MLLLIGSIIDAGVGLITGAMAEEGAGERNEAQIASAREQMDFQAKQARIGRSFNRRQAFLNRRFQKRMSNTAVRRQVADMRKAGINPILSARFGGASSPGGSMATSGGPPPGAQPTLEDATGKGIAAGLAARESSRAARMANQEIQNMKAQESVATEQAKEITMKTELAKANTAKSYAETVKATNDALEAAERTLGYAGQRDKTKAETGRLGAELKALEAQLTGLLNEQEIDKTTYGKLMRKIKRAREATGFSAVDLIPGGPSKIIRYMKGLIR